MINSKKNKRILLVDDDPDDRNLFAEAVAVVDPDATIVFKRDGEELLEYLRAAEGQSADIIFLDLNMPRRNGKECLAQIRSRQEFSGLPIVIYTTSMLSSDIEETFRLGATWFFQKPTSFRVLRNVLGDLLTKPKPPAETLAGKSDFVIKPKPDMRS